MSGRTVPGTSTGAYALKTGVPAILVDVGPGSHVSHSVATQQGSYEHIFPVEVNVWPHAKDPEGVEVSRALSVQYQKTQIRQS